jgi:glycyl-tRNA synthetase beta subunit
VIWGVLDHFWTPRRLSNLCRELQNDQKQLFWVYFGGFGSILAFDEGFCNN